MLYTLTRLVFVIFLSGLSITAFALPNLGLGPFGPGVQDGSAPFNTDGNCGSATATAAAGDDCGEANNQARTQDSVVFNWSVTASDYTPGQENPKNVILEQILTPSTNAVISFERIPARCTPAGGGGSTPPSALTTEANGDIKLICNLGEFNEGAQLSFSTVAKISGESWNAESFTSTQRVYSNDDNGTANTSTFVYPQIGPIAISARPMMDLSSSGFRGYYLYGARDIGQGVENGYYTWVNMRVSSSRKAGIEAIQQPFSFGFDLSATKQAVNGTDYTASGFEYYMISCTYNYYGYWGGEVFGKETYHSGYPIKQKVIDSGDCGYTRNTPANNSSPYTITVDNADLSGNRFPTLAGGNIDLSSGPYYYTSTVARFFIPMRVIDNEDGVMDGVGSIYIKNILKDFDPVGVSGALNFNGAKEPGFNGNPMPNGDVSNNIATPYNYYLKTQGTFADYAFTTNTDTGSGYTYWVSGSSHSGQGLVPPTQAYPNTLHFGNNGSNDLSHPRTCLAFDNSTQKLTDRSKTGGTAGTYAYVGTYSANGFDSTNYIVEYGHVDYTGDDPLDNNGDGTTDYNNQTGRYEGNWDQQRAVRCDDATTTWNTDPTQIGSGIDDVNIVRVRLKDSVKDTAKLSSSQYIRFITPLEARQTFYKGPHNGEMVPMGTVLAAFGSAKSDEYYSGWTSRSYIPAPENGSTDGDRVTLARTTAQLDSESLLPIATPGQTASTLAGKQIVWKINTAIQSLLPVPSDEENVQIIDELPPEVSYNKNCTINYQDAGGTVIGTPADLVNYNTGRDGNAKTGYTQLIWNLGTVTANDPIAPRIICTDSDALAPNGTAVVNYAEIRGDTLISALSQRNDTHTITLEQIGSIQVSKTVDTTLDDVNDSQLYTLSWANFAPTFSIAEPTIIDVLPFNGDDGANSTRTPPSVFEGSLKLTGAPATTWLSSATDGAPLGTWYYTSDAPAGINHDPDNNTSNWVLEAALGGDFSTVTAIKFVSNYRLEKDGDPHQGMKTTFTLAAGDNTDPNSPTSNKPGDIYTNLFTLDTSSLPADQFLRSNPVSVSIASYSVGDLIFADTDGDLKYTAGTDIPAPDDIVVELHKASDDSLVATTTTGIKGSGRYLFVDIGSGDYYVTIPASQFASNATLEGWDSLVTTAGADDDVNDDAGQDGYTVGTVINDGVRTNVFTLSAIPPLPGDVPKGNEPLGDNTGGITDTTDDDFSNHTFDIGLKPALDYGDAPSSYGNAGHGVPITPTVYLGALFPDTESNLQNTANGGLDGLGDDQTGVHDEDSIQLLPPLRTQDTRFQVNVSTHNSSSKDAILVAWVDFNNNGTFDTNEASTIVPVTTGNGGTKSLVWDNIPAASIQAGDLWMRIRLSTDTNLTADNATNALFDGEVEDYKLKASNGVRVSGFVFNDDNVSAGVKENSDNGIASVTVVLFDIANNSCSSVKTNTEGYYQFDNIATGNYTLYESASEAVSTPKNCAPNEADLTSYRSTTANVRQLTVTTADIEHQDFGDVLLPTFSPNHSKTVLPNNVVLYAHTFTPKSTGAVTFASSNSTPASNGWTNIIYQDANCDGVLNGAEANSPITSNLATTANTDICLINKVYAPSNVANGETFSNVINANFDFGNAIAGNVTLKVTDLTKAAANDTKLGSSKLDLRKTVQNITQNGVETEKQNQAKPSDVLKYRIYYSNTGNGPLTDLEIKDTVPDFTTIIGSPICEVPLPNSLTSCTPSLTGDAIEWVFPANDALKGGASGVVSYEVKID